MTEMLLGLARTVRRGRNTPPDMAAAAAAREVQLQAELFEVVEGEAASFVAGRGEDPDEHKG